MYKRIVKTQNNVRQIWTSLTFKKLQQQINSVRISSIYGFRAYKTMSMVFGFICCYVFADNALKNLSSNDPTTRRKTTFFMLC